MKLLSHHSSCQPPVRVATTHAFTLAEMMTVVAIFSMIAIGMISLQVFGFKMNAFTSSKLAMTADGLKALNQIRNRIRQATNAVMTGNVGVMIGNFDVGNNKFTPIVNGNLIGNAVQISNNPADYVTFYVSTNSFGLTKGNLFMKSTNGQPIVLTHSNIIYQPAFQAEDYNGNIIAANSSEHYTIHMMLQFQKLDFTTPTVTYDYYQLESRGTPRNQKF